MQWGSGETRVIPAKAGASLNEALSLTRSPRLRGWQRRHRLFTCCLQAHTLRPGPEPGPHSAGDRRIMWYAPAPTRGVALGAVGRAVYLSTPSKGCDWRKVAKAPPYGAGRRWRGSLWLLFAPEL